VSLDRRGICELEATGISWRSVERWLDALDLARLAARCREAGSADAGDDKARPAERFEARRSRTGTIAAADWRPTRPSLVTTSPQYQKPLRSRLEKAGDISPFGGF
jgi:hypothetical protein